MSETADPHHELIHTFYDAFARYDGVAMEACYAPDVTFSDPVFPGLKGAEAGGMWRMLTTRASDGGDLVVELHEHTADGDSGTAHWIARYTFETGNKVVNDIHAKFRFKDGLIAEHVDDFDFHKWSRQALGLPGLLFGWTPVLRGAVRKQARASLDKFLADEQPR